MTDLRQAARSLLTALDESGRVEAADSTVTALRAALSTQQETTAMVAWVTTRDLQERFPAPDQAPPAADQKETTP